MICILLGRFSFLYHRGEKRPLCGSGQLMANKRIRTPYKPPPLAQTIEIPVIGQRLQPWLAMAINITRFFGDFQPLVSFMADKVAWQI